MPPIIDVSTLTDGAKLATSMADTITKETFTDPKLNDFHDVNEGIKAGQEVPVMDLMTGPMGKVKANCDVTANSLVQINTSKKTWAPAFIQDRIAICYDEFTVSFMKWLLKNGLSKTDITGTEIALFLEERAKTLLAETIWEKMYFTDKSAVAGTNNGFSGGQLPYFTPIDGFFKRGFAIVGGTSQRITVAKNAGATNALQKFDAADTTNAVVTGYLDEMYYNADVRLRGKSDLVYLVTQSVFDQYTRERKNPLLDAAYKRTEDGITGISCNGIPVIPVNVWDRKLAEYFQVVTGGNTNTFLPHRAILTTRTNLKPGTEDMGNLSEFDIFYDKKDKKFYMDFAFMFDTNIAIDEYLMMAY